MINPDDAPREHYSNLTDPPWSIVASGRVLGTGNTGTDAWRAVLATTEAERDALRARAEAAEAALATVRAEVDAAFQQGLTAGQVATCGALSAIAAEVASAGFDETATAIRIAAATLIKADLRLERGPVESA